ncbi:MAG: hypothetical protein ACPGSE_00375 [Synechococcus sp.]
MLNFLKLLFSPARPISAMVYPPGHVLVNDDGDTMTWPNHVLITIRIRDIRE